VRVLRPAALPVALEPPALRFLRLRAGFASVGFSSSIVPRQFAAPQRQA
jgi:hypothetical protein